MENPPFEWYFPGKMGDFRGQTVSFREGIFNAVEHATERSPFARVRHQKKTEEEIRKKIYLSTKMNNSTELDEYIYISAQVFVFTSQIDLKV